MCIFSNFSKMPARTSALSSSLCNEYRHLAAEKKRKQIFHKSIESALSVCLAVRIKGPFFSFFSRSFNPQKASLQHISYHRYLSKNKQKRKPKCTAEASLFEIQGWQTAVWEGIVEQNSRRSAASLTLASHRTGSLASVGMSPWSVSA